MLLTSDRQRRRGTIHVCDGKVADVTDVRIGGLDFGDALLLPGGVDVHVHSRSYVGEGIERCTTAAAAGGVTTIVDMPYDSAGPVDTLAKFEAKSNDVRREAVIDVALWATIPPRGPIEHVGDLVGAGAAAFKLSTFETHPERFPRIPDNQLLDGFASVAAAGGMVGVHAENDEMVVAGIAAQRASGFGSDPLAHSRSRPPVVEHEAIGRVLEIARATGVRLHICHVSTPRGAELVRQALVDGIDVSLETCPHYLLLDESELSRRGGEAKVNPPLRETPLSSDFVDVIASDHVGWPIERKRGPDIFELASGFPGVELIVSLVHDAVGVTEMVRLVSEQPAKRFGLWPRKGTLRPGSDADVLVLEADREWVIDPACMVTAAGWSPYAGRRVKGRVIATFSRGVQVWDGENVCAAAGRGCFVPSASAMSIVTSHV